MINIFEIHNVTIHSKYIFMLLFFFPSVVPTYPPPGTICGVNKRFADMTPMEQRCYTRLRGPQCAAGNPIKEIPVDSLLGHSHRNKKWFRHRKEGVEPVVHTTPIAGKN